MSNKMINGKNNHLETPLPRDGAISNTLGPGPEYWFLWYRSHAPRNRAHALRPGPWECHTNHVYESRRQREVGIDQKESAKYLIFNLYLNNIN